MNNINFIFIFICLSVFVLGCNTGEKLDDDTRTNVLETSNECKDVLQTKENVKSLVEAWVKDVDEVEEDHPYSDYYPYLHGLDSYKRMVDCGVQIIPYIIEMLKVELKKGEITSNQFIIQFPPSKMVLYTIVCESMSQKVFSDEYYSNGNGRAQSQIDWWEHGYLEDIQLFNFFYEEYKSKKDETVIKKMQNLGICILPSLIVKVEEGDLSLIPIVNRLTKKKFEKKTWYSQRLSVSNLSKEEKVSIVKEWWKCSQRLYDINRIDWIID